MPLEWRTDGVPLNDGKGDDSAIKEEIKSGGPAPHRAPSRVDSTAYVKDRSFCGVGVHHAGRCDCRYQPDAARYAPGRSSGRTCGGARSGDAFGTYRTWAASSARFDRDSSASSARRSRHVACDGARDVQEADSTCHSSSRNSAEPPGCMCSDTPWCSSKARSSRCASSCDTRSCSAAALHRRVVGRSNRGSSRRRQTDRNLPWPSPLPAPPAISPRDLH